MFLIEFFNSGTCFSVFFFSLVSRWVFLGLKSHQLRILSEIPTTENVEAYKNIQLSVFMLIKHESKGHLTKFFLKKKVTLCRQKEQFDFSWDILMLI